MRLAQFIERLEGILRERGDIEVIRLDVRGYVRRHQGPEVSYRHAAHRGVLTTHEPDAAESVCKV